MILHKGHAITMPMKSTANKDCNFDQIQLHEREQNEQHSGKRCDRPVNSLTGEAGHTSQTFTRACQKCSHPGRFKQELQSSYKPLTALAPSVELWRISGPHEALILSYFTLLNANLRATWPKGHHWYRLLPFRFRAVLLLVNRPLADRLFAYGYLPYITLLQNWLLLHEIQ